MRKAIASALIATMSICGSAAELTPLPSRVTVPLSGVLARSRVLPPPVRYQPPHPKTTLHSIALDASLILFFVLLTPRSK